ncbi:MAG: alpha/beta hydrolase, partial [Clostridia bacterium]|nr:alpha/beta hydrolase [Clostridia bacterium]
TIQIDGMNIHYIDEGQGDVVLLLHGWNAPAETYRLIIDLLSSRFRVIAPNAPGCGGSDEPPTAWTVNDFVDFTVKFAKALDIQKATLMGHSFGGRTIIKLMNRVPRPFVVDKIVLLDAAGIKPKRSLSYYAKVYSFKAMKAVCGVPPFKQLFPNAVENARKKRGSADYRAASDVMRRTMSLCINEELTKLLGGVDVPTLLIWGENDTATPLRDAKIMENGIPDAGLVVLEGAGHFAFAERWGQCSRVLDVFLK